MPDAGGGCSSVVIQPEIGMLRLRARPTSVRKLLLLLLKECCSQLAYFQVLYALEFNAGSVGPEVHLTQKFTRPLRAAT